MRFVSILRERQNDPRGRRPPLAVCLGDSVTHGCFECVESPGDRLDTVYEPESGYAAKLQALLRERYPAAAPTVLNAGVGGDNAPGGLRRLERDALSFSPDLLIVCYGLNDCTFPDREAGLRQYARALREIFALANKSGAECLLLTPNTLCRYVDDRLRGKFAEYARTACSLQEEGVLDRYVETAKGVAREAGVSVADAYSVWLYMHKDGRDTTALLANHINHPTRDMHALFARLLLEAIFPHARP